MLKAGGVAGGAPNPTPFPARRRRKTQIGAGDAVYEALWRAVADRRIVGFKHPLSQALLSQENALLCVRNALETPTAGDAQRILKAAHSVLKETARSRQKARGEGKPVAFYDYVDEQQKLLYQVVRFRPKRFSQRRPYKDGWAWGTTEGDYVKGHRGNLFLDNDAPEAAERVSLDACKQVLYRLPRALATLKAGSAVHIVEGEEDVHALEALGLTATCNSGGAGKWNDAYAEVFRGGLAYVLPDNDPAGHDHAQRIVESLADVAKHVQLVRLPGLPPKGDVRDWLKTHDRQQLIAQITQSSPGH